MLTIRPAHLEDAEAIAQVHVQAWRETYRGIVPDDFLAAIDVAKKAAHHTEHIPKGGYFVVEKDGKVAGFVCCGLKRKNTDPTQGEIYAIYLLDAVKGQGMGEKLMRTAADHLSAQGYKDVSLWVVAENSRAKSFYEALGGVVIAEEPIVLGGKSIPEVQLSWKLDEETWLTQQAAKPKKSGPAI